DTLADLCRLHSLHSDHVFLLQIPPTPRPTLFPYTTLFRSQDLERRGAARLGDVLRERANGRDGARDEQSREHGEPYAAAENDVRDRKSTRLNSSHVSISYAVFCLKKKKSKATEKYNLVECA